MQTKRVACVALSLILTVLTSRAQERSIPASPGLASFGGGRIRSNYGNVPLMFEANQGQTDSQVRFLSHGSGYSVFLTAGGMVLALQASETTSSADFVPAPAAKRIHPGFSPIRQQARIARQRKSTVLAIDLAGAAANPTIVGEQPLSTRINYFIGRDPSKWRRNIPTYSQIRYKNVYPGIDLVYYGNNHQVEYDFDLAPGANAANIQFSVKGADALSVDSAGNLVLSKGPTQMLFQMPIIYQVINGTRAPVGGKYVLRDATHVGFSVASHDSTKPMVIDPVLVYSTFLGGSADDFSNAIAVDSAGDAYVTGITDSPNFPKATLGSYTSNQFRAFLVKFNPAGSGLIFADYFGGTTGNDEAAALALDSSGNAYVTGSASSSDFPVVNPYQSTLSGAQDAFLAQFSADGSTLTYATYLGGSNSQFATSVSVDSAGEAVIAGITQSINFPMVSAFQSSVSADQFGDWGEYGFVTKFVANPAGISGSLAYSTYLAGSTLNASSCTSCSPDTQILGVATDGSGNAYLTGFTTTSNFPVTSGAYATTSPGSSLSDVGFVSKLTSAGGLAYSTYLGGFTSSFLNAIAVDSSGDAYVTGYDMANDGFPNVIPTTSICDPSVSACNGAIIAKLDPTGASLVYSTFLGTSNNMAGQAIQVDASGDAFIVGSDIGFDLANPIEAYAGNGDVVVAEISPSATNLLMATFLGGQGWEAASGLALDGSGAVYVTGVTQSPDFPVTQSAFQTGLGGQTDAFIAKIDPTTSAPAVSMGPSSLQFGNQNVATTSAPQTSILRNMGSAALTISGKTTGADFAESDDCGATVPAASFCTFTVAFTPTTSGSLVEALTITDDATGSPHAVTLSGTGISGPHYFRILPVSLGFSSSPVDSVTTSQSVTVTNTSNAPLNISGVQVTGDFAATGSNCGIIAANGTCTVRVSFTPRSAGIRAGTLRLVSSGTSSPQVMLSGSGVDFVSVPTNTRATVKAGGSATFQLNVGSVGGSFSNLVSFSCKGAPALSTCTVSPSSITPGSNTSTVAVTVKTTGAVAQNRTPGDTRGRFLAAWMFGQMGIFGVLVVGAKNRRKFRPYAASAVVGMLLLLVGCGLGGTQQSVVSNTTPQGSYSLSVVASSGNLQHVTKLLIIVQ